MKRVLLFLSLTLSALVGGLFVAPSANASSPYDNYINNLSNLDLSNNNISSCSPNRPDISLDWSYPLNIQPYDYIYPQYPTEPSGYFSDGTRFVTGSGSTAYTQERRDLWDNKEHWLVKVSKDSSGQFISAYIVFTNDPDAHFVFEQGRWGYGEMNLIVQTGYNVGVAYINPVDIGGECGLRYELGVEYAPFYYSDNRFNILADPSVLGSTREYIYLATPPLVIPDGYQGQIPTDTITPPDSPIDYWVNFTYTNSTQYITAKYKNKNTEPVSSLPDPKQVDWKLWKNGTLIQDGGEVVCEATRKIDHVFNSMVDCDLYNFTPDKNATYYLSVEVNPLSNLNEGLFPQYPSSLTFKRTFYKVDFSQSGAGDTQKCEGGAIDPSMSVFCLENPQFNVIDCFQIDFPFIDIPSCNETFSILFTNIIFGGLSFPELNYDPACKSLTTMDDWLGLPQGYQVCPQIPSDVRAIVTPFVAFLLGLVTMGFITKVRRDFDG